jgi:uncharacterized membrane protein YedE/YeeE
MSQAAIGSNDLARRLAYTLAAGISGFVFGIGLAVAQMTNPEKVLNFLDVSGAWDPSLLLVLGAAVALTALAYHYVLKQKRPLFDTTFHLPVARLIDRPLVLGAALFGIGWGVAGYCPGPAIASIGFGNPEALWFVPAMFVGSALRRLQEKRRLEGS